MPPTPAGPSVVISGGQDLKSLFTAYSSALANARSDNSTMYQRFALVPDAGAMMAANVTQGTRPGPDGRMQGYQFLRFPIPMTGKAPEKWNWGVARKAGPAQYAYIEMELTRWAPPDEEQYYDLLDNAAFGMIRNNLELMLDRAPKVWDYILADAINTNAIGYDGVAFFSTAHPANSTDLSIGQPYSNDIQIPAINVASLREAISRLTLVPGMDGQPLDTGANTKVLAIAPNVDIGMQLMDIFQGSIQVVTPSAVSAATGPNEGLRGQAEVVIWKDLRRGNPLADTPGVGTANRPVGVKSGLTVDNVFYLVSVPTGLQRPFLLVPKRMPTPHYEGLNANDRSRIDMGGVRYGWDAFGGACLALPQRAMRVQITG